jgi:ketosteroid isomerase-like protein
MAAFAGALEDRLAVRERVEAYGDAVFRHDAEAWIACWSDDAVWRLPGMEVATKPKIKAAWEGAMAGFTLAAFFSTPGSIRVAGETAEARIYTQETLILQDGAARRIVGAYDDRLVKVGAEWLFAERTYAILHDQAG